MKLLIIGMDGMSDRAYWDRDIPMHFVRNELMPNSFYGTSIATTQKNKEGRIDPHTGPNWSTIYTGVDCTEHGIDYGGWLQAHKSHGDLRVKSVWYTIREMYKLGLIGMPVTYPAFECEWMISGFPNSLATKNSIYPKHMAHGLINKKFVVDYGDGLTSWRDKLYKGWKKGEKEKFFKIEFQKLELARQLHSINPVDVLAFGSTMIDKSCHIFKMFSEQTIETYKKSDKLIRKLVNAFNPENVIICSDHGFQPVLSRHAIEGFYIWHNKDITESRRLQISIMDVYDIILTSLGIAIGNKEPMTPVEYEQEDKEGIIHRLKQLGYL